MSILVNKNTRVLTQGITGATGQIHTRACRDYGTQMVGGVVPGKGGTDFESIPIFDTVAEAVAGADLVILAAPILALRELLSEAEPYLGPNAVVTDLGSTKTEIVRWAAESLPTVSRFVGGHPMVGSEQSGIAAADTSASCA